MAEVQAPQVQAESEAPPVWECCVCMTDGASTARLLLACKHNVCLSCYTGMVNAAPTYAKNSIKCPMCRRGIRNTDEPPQEVTAEISHKIRACIQIKNRLTQLQRDAENAAGSLDRAMANLRELADEWGLWEQAKASYERLLLAPAPAAPLPAAPAQPVRNPAPAAVPAAPEEARSWCPGCRRMMANVRHRRIGQTTRRLKRCDNCARG